MQINIILRIVIYLKSGNFHVKIIHVLNNHFDLFSWVYGTHENILTYFNTNIYYRCISVCSSVSHISREKVSKHTNMFMILPYCHCSTYLKYTLPYTTQFSVDCLLCLIVTISAHICSKKLLEWSNENLTYIVYCIRVTCGDWVKWFCYMEVWDTMLGLLIWWPFSIINFCWVL